MTPTARPRQIRPLVETFVLAGVGGLLFDSARFPAGWMTGAMVFATIAALAGRPIHVPPRLARIFFVALGVAIGGVATPETLHGMVRWPASIAMLAVAMLAITGAGTGYLALVHRWDAQTALFASVPGALSQVAVLAAERDADLRAIMIVQTLRLTALAVGVPAAFALLGLSGPTRLPAEGPGMLAAPEQALALFGGSVVAALLLARAGFAGGYFFGPMAVSAALHGGGFIQIQLPAPFAAAAMAGLGAVIGSRFNGTSFRTLLDYLAASIGSLLVSLAAAGLFVMAAAFLLSLRVLDLVASYAPGSVDAMMILALALHLDPVFVGAHHLARIVLVTLALPIGVRLTARAPPAPHDLPAPLHAAREALED